MQLHFCREWNRKKVRAQNGSFRQRSVFSWRKEDSSFHRAAQMQRLHPATATDAEVSAWEQEQGDLLETRFFKLHFLELSKRIDMDLEDFSKSTPRYTMCFDYPNTPPARKGFLEAIREHPRSFRVDVPDFLRTREASAAAAREAARDPLCVRYMPPGTSLETLRIAIRNAPSCCVPEAFTPPRHDETAPSWGRHGTTSYSRSACLSLLEEGPLWVGWTDWSDECIVAKAVEAQPALLSRTKGAAFDNSRFVVKAALRGATRQKCLSQVRPHLGAALQKDVEFWEEVLAELGGSALAAAEKDMRITVAWRRMWRRICQHVSLPIIIEDLVLAY